MELTGLGLNTALLLQAFVTVLVILDPFGNVPIFLALTRRWSAQARQRTALQSVAVASGVILVFAVFGQQLLGLLGISLEALQVAGGVLLGLVALDLLRSDCQDADHHVADQESIAFVPLGTPLLAGPGAIAATMLFMERAQGPGGVVSVVLALIGALVVVYAALRWAPLIGRLLRENGLNLVTRVTGLLVAAIAVQLVASAVQQWTTAGVS